MRPHLGTWRSWPAPTTPRTRLGFAALHVITLVHSGIEFTGRLDAGGADLQASTGELSIDTASN